MDGTSHCYLSATDVATQFSWQNQLDPFISLVVCFHLLQIYHPLHKVPSSKYHTILFKVPPHPLQSTKPPSLCCYTIQLAKSIRPVYFICGMLSPSSNIPHHFLKVPLSKYHTTLFKVPHNPLQSTTYTTFSSCNSFV